MPTTDTEDGRVADRYQLRRQIGVGGMGVVWEALDELLGRRVAIKAVELPATVVGVERAKFSARVLREARAAARLTHQSVVTLYDVIREHGTTYIVMELVEARSLQKLVREDGRLEPERAARIGLQVLAALEEAHGKGIVHRDIKPGNVLILPNGQAKLTDFGIARLHGDPKLTATGIVLGSPGYMAPEQASGDASEPSTDLYGLGATLYYAVEGRAPFEKDGAIPTMTAVVMEAPRPMRHAGPLAPIITDLLAKRPEERPTSVEVRRRLGKVAGTASEPASAVQQHPDGAADSSPDGSPGAAALAPAPAAAAPDTAAPDTAAPSAAAAPASATGTAQAGTGTQAEAGAAAAAAAAGASLAEGGQAGAAERAPADGHEARRDDWHDGAGGAPGAGGLAHAGTTAGTAEADRPGAAGTAVVAPVTGVPGTMAPGPATRGPGVARRPGPLLALAGALLAAAVVVVAIVATRSDDGASNSASGGTAAPTTTVRSGGAPTTGEGSTATTDPPTSTRAETSTSGGETGGGEATAAPAGWREYRGPGGVYRLAYPPDWTVRRAGGPRIDFIRPGGGTYLRIDWSDQPKEPLENWTTYERQFAASHAGYQKIRLEGGRFNGMRAALWEYRYRAGGRLVHAINHTFVTPDGRYAYAFNFQTRDEDWGASAGLRDDLQRNFRVRGAPGS
jgi:hypothetical protein